MYDNNVDEHIRILDVDGTYVISIVRKELKSGVLHGIIEKAFDCDKQAEDFLEKKFQIDFGREKEKEYYMGDIYE